MRAILLASATATTLKGRRARSCVSQGYFPGFSWARRNTAIAPLETPAPGRSFHVWGGGNEIAYPLVTPTRHMSIGLMR